MVDNERPEGWSRITLNYGTSEAIEVDIPPEYTLVRKEQYYRLQAAANILSDLDRNEHGRHAGDSDGGDPTGISQAGSLLSELQRIVRE